MTDLHWLPECEGWSEALRALALEGPPDSGAHWSALARLAAVRLDFRMTGMLDRALRRIAADAPPACLPSKPVRLAVLGSSTVDHLLPAIRVGGLRRDLWIATYAAGYGQYLQELSNPASGLHGFAPTVILLALDARHLVGELSAAASAAEADSAVEAAVAHCVGIWQRARKAFDCRIIHQTPVPVFRPLLGHNEHRLPGSRLALLARLTRRLREASGDHGVDLLSLDALVAEQGLDAWHDPRFWHKAKHEVRAAAAPVYGDHVARLLAAQQGRSFKCLVLDLDNTLWGGVIGDDGLEGIVLGQGSSTGEAFVALQHYALALSQRGVILAVCSKNDEANAMLPFERHPDMVLKRSDIACFVANWSDKAANIRAIAEELNIGLDSLVFIDDNPFERNLVRQELPMVAVPEVSEDPTGYPAAIADAGYFEGLAVTDEDRERTTLYQGNKARDALKASATDLPGYLRGLEMRLIVKPFDRIGLQRIVQLINKSNQFNLTTRRYTDEDVIAVMADPDAFGLQLRLLDRFGDNGIIAIVIGRLQSDMDLLLDTWLMSCRVLGRQVEPTTLNLIAAEALKLGAKRLVGEYIATKKNGMVKDHYAKLGFSVVETGPSGSRAVLDLAGYQPAATFIHVAHA